MTTCPNCKDLAIPIAAIQELMVVAGSLFDGDPGRWWTEERILLMKPLSAWMWHMYGEDQMDPLNAQLHSQDPATTTTQKE
jgi:hypothetical protein